jgi:hypothetical protein
LSLHEAIAVALLNNRQREATFDEVAYFIEQRNLYPERKGVVSLTDQVMLRATKSDGAYDHLFERVGDEKIRLRNLVNTL